jgi:hypothetical protein
MKMRKKNSPMMNRVCDTFTKISETLLEVPNNVTEMVALQTFIDKVRTTQMRMLDEEVEEAKKRYLFFDLL